MTDFSGARRWAERRWGQVLGLMTEDEVKALVKTHFNNGPARRDVMGYLRDTGRIGADLAPGADPIPMAAVDPTGRGEAGLRSAKRAGDVVVKPYMRGGKPVAGYVRERPKVAKRRLSHRRATPDSTDRDSTDRDRRLARAEARVADLERQIAELRAMVAGDGLD